MCPEGVIEPAWGERVELVPFWPGERTNLKGGQMTAERIEVPLKRGRLNGKTKG